MLSVCTRKFLSHSNNNDNNNNENQYLIDHLLKVGKSSKVLFSQTKFLNQDLVFYSGLLHDVGKLNPFYQEIFNASKSKLEETKEKSLKKYVQKHSVFSAWAAHQLLKKLDLDDDTIDKIMIMIYGHHSKIRRSLGKIPDDEKFRTSQNEISLPLSEFSLQTSNISEFSKLDWDSCQKKFSRPIEFDINLDPQNSPVDPQNSPDNFLEMSCAFSCLLQADQGSFNIWTMPNFDIQLNTESQLKKSDLGTFRTDFQNQVIENVQKNFDSEPILVINAPTGIGKTKAFLDIINEYSKNNDIQRIFYFSPLLALTEDFETKIASVISNDDDKDVLVYNHMYSGSLKEKNKLKEEGIQNSNRWMFENESFNKKFVITTTQRLLMTIYSNKSQDKMKMASFRNSVLIIDEVQTMPKPILSNLKEIFKKMNQYMGTKFILVSATIPHEIRDIKRIELSKNILTEYLLRTKKHISVQSSLDVAKIPFDKTLVMANTRRKAINLYLKIDECNTGKEIIYLSTGIRKKNRINIIKTLSKKSNYVLVATQVVEAGVDISFSHIFREEAPLDNIIQVMGRLNREGKNSNARLVIYSTDQNHVPYSLLEFEETRKKLENITNSIQIYEILEDYYEEISVLNKSNKDKTKELEQLIARMDFDGVWKFVKNMALQEDGRDTVFIPDKQDDWDDIKDKLLRNTLHDNFKKFADLTTTLPVSFKKMEEISGKKMDEMFDNELMDKNILLPKKCYVEKIYDEKMGLDKWAIEQNSV